MKKYDIVSRNETVGIKARGAALPALFENAAQGIFSCLLAPVEMNLGFHRTIELAAGSHEALLARWLNELLYISARMNIIITACSVRELTEHSLKAEIWGRKKLSGQTEKEMAHNTATDAIRIRKTKTGFHTNVTLAVG